MSLRSVAVCLLLVFAACAQQPRAPYSTELDLFRSLPEDRGNLVDARARFREIFCAVLQDHGEQWPDYMTCREALSTVGREPPPTGRLVDLGPPGEEYTVGLVPGLGWQCVKTWLDYDSSRQRYLDEMDWHTLLFEVDGLSGTASNARQINEHITNLPSEDRARPLILAGYSKGAADLLEFVARYPETAKQVVAVVAVAGAVFGSPLADEHDQNHVDLLTWVPRAGCDKGDGSAIESLRPLKRGQWLAENPLPAHIRYYSVVSWPDPDNRISLGLKPSHRKLGELSDTHNDGQLVYYDQIIPNSTLVALPNADHWAMGLPIARQYKIAASTFVTRNEYPREAFYEALIRFVIEDLEGTGNGVGPRPVGLTADLAKMPLIARLRW